jgi:hypothetical protein
MEQPFKNAGKDFLKVRTVSAIQVPLCTSDHRFAVVDDPLKPEIYWTEAKNLTGKYIVSNKQVNLYNDEQMSVLVGTLLGDSCISSKSVISYGHSEKQKDYAEFKQKILGGDGHIGKVYKTEWGACVGYTTRVTAQTHKIAEMVRHEGSKKVENILHMLNEIGLAFWYMDDGVYADCSYKQSRPNARLCTHGFTYDQHLSMVETFKNRFGLEPKIRTQNQNGNEYFFLEFLKDDSETFWKIVSKYIHESMDYKLPSEFRTEPENKHKFNTDRLGYSLHQVVSVVPCARKSALYDITVENNHNFFADGVLIHNCIDRLVTNFKPDIVIVEAYWVVPEKFDILSKLHPKVKWVIRNHSALPFLANEGIAMDWSLRYMDYKNVYLCSNDFRTNAEMRDMISVYKNDWTREEVERRVTLLSNYYPETFRPRPAREESDTLDISCFGALRPLKNHLIQAVAAIQYAESVGKKLRFHINGTRVEMKGEPIAHNLQKMFRLLPCELVEHPWKDHGDFCNTLREMDVAMQVSYTETFNIVTADAVVNDVPVITSADIVWVDEAFYADPNDSKSIKAAIERAITAGKSANHAMPNREGLHKFNIESMRLWNNFVRNIT